MLFLSGLPVVMSIRAERFEMSPPVMNALFTKWIEQPALIKQINHELKKKSIQTKANSNPQICLWPWWIHKKTPNRIML